MKKRIVVVEDDTPTLELIKETLLEKDYEVTTSDNGKEAEQLIIQSRPDLIILDVMLPGVNGFELAERLKKNKITFHIPIIMLTVKEDYGSRLTGFMAGAIEYIPKPFSLENLLEKIEKTLSRK